MGDDLGQEGTNCTVEKEPNNILNALEGVFSNLSQVAVLVSLALCHELHDSLQIPSGAEALEDAGELVLLLLFVGLAQSELAADGSW